MKSKEIYMYILGALVAIGFFVVLGLFIFKEIPDKNSTAMNILLGVLASGLTTVLSYFFGSSKGSADKTEIMSKQNNGNNKPLNS
jgi:hypothetical protein